MKEKVYGYARVSTKEQHEDRQISALLKAGIEKEDIFIDKQSGKDFNRPKYKKLLRRLKKGDAVFISSIDRLGRNYAEIMDQWRIMTREKEVDVVVLDMPLLDTRQKGDDLTGIFIADLVLQILSYVAQKERENIRARQAEGIAAAKARGVKFGRQKMAVPPNFRKVAIRWRRKEITLKEALEELKVGRTYFFKKIKELGI
ncbi:recombinase family protein [Christensenella intestinihominis]|uniref:recombinase family protein n=1 Tax=Christensenella intestinihominis TaxID=1851429 RepID=UPI0008364BEE|nr:recombinase family protein [Christensenella intestinihominis]